MNNNHTLNVTAAAEETGEWIQYYSGNAVRLNLAPKYYALRFSKPSNWGNLLIEKVKIIILNSTGKNINLCFWNNSDGNFPQGSPLKVSRSVTGDVNIWNVTSASWTTSNSEFFVGLQQVEYVTLCADGNNSPENRSYKTNSSGSTWENEWGSIANYCIAIYVTKK